MTTTTITLPQPGDTWITVSDWEDWDCLLRDALQVLVADQLDVAEWHEGCRAVEMDGGFISDQEWARLDAFGLRARLTGEAYDRVREAIDSAWCYVPLDEV